MHFRRKMILTMLFNVVLRFQTHKFVVYKRGSTPSEHNNIIIIMIHITECPHDLERVEIAR